MTSLTTQRVTVSAESFFQEQYSDPERQQYIHAYRIVIQNDSRHAIQLLSRAWEVIDATGSRRRVEGKGVVGQQPVIAPGQQHAYTSWVQFETPIGAMRGSYVMARIGERDARRLFQVEVPQFLHLSPEVLN